MTEHTSQQTPWKVCWMVSWKNYGLKTPGRQGLPL